MFNKPLVVILIAAMMVICSINQARGAALETEEQHLHREKRDCCGGGGCSDLNVACGSLGNQACCHGLVCILGFCIKAPI